MSFATPRRWSIRRRDACVYLSCMFFPFLFTFHVFFLFYIHYVFSILHDSVWTLIPIMSVTKVISRIIKINFFNYAFFYFENPWDIIVDKCSDKPRFNLHFFVRSSRFFSFVASKIFIFQCTCITNINNEKKNYNYLISMLL